MQGPYMIIRGHQVLKSSFPQDFGVCKGDRLDHLAEKGLKIIINIFNFFFSRWSRRSPTICRCPKCGEHAPDLRQPEDQRVRNPRPEDQRPRDPRPEDQRPRDPRPEDQRPEGGRSPRGKSPRSQSPGGKSPRGQSPGSKNPKRDACDMPI